MRNKKWMLCAFMFTLLADVLPTVANAQGHRKVIIDQDCAGPGGTDMQAIVALINSPDTDVLGITVVTGDAWRDEEVQHTLRTLELLGRTDVPVVPGAVFPLVRTQRGTRLSSQIDGRVNWLGAWGDGPTSLDNQATHGSDPARAHDPYFVPPMPEG